MAAAKDADDRPADGRRQVHGARVVADIEGRLLEKRGEERKVAVLSQPDAGRVPPCPYDFICTLVHAASRSRGQAGGPATLPGSATRRRVPRNGPAGHDFTVTLASPPGKTAANCPAMKAVSQPESPGLRGRKPSGTATAGSPLGSVRPMRFSAKRCWFSTSPARPVSGDRFPEGCVWSRRPRSSRRDAAKIGSTSAPPRTTLRTALEMGGHGDFKPRPVEGRRQNEVGVCVREIARSARQLLRGIPRAVA